MQGRANEYSGLRGWWFKRIVDKQRYGNSIAPIVVQPSTEDGENYEFVEDYKRDGIPDPDADYSGRKIY